MKKVIILTFVFIFCFGMGINYVSAQAINSPILIADEAKSNTAKDCSSYGFGDPKTKGTFAYYLQKVFNIMKFLGIIIAILMTIKDLVLAIAEDQKETLNKLGKKTLKRIIYAFLIFFLPDLINLVFGIMGLYGTCGIQ